MHCHRNAKNTKLSAPKPGAPEGKSGLGALLGGISDIFGKPLELFKKAVYGNVESGVRGIGNAVDSVVRGIRESHAGGVGSLSSQTDFKLSNKKVSEKGVPYTTDEPAEIARLRRQYPLIGKKEDEIWEKSNVGYRFTKQPREFALVVYEAPDKKSVQIQTFKGKYNKNSNAYNTVDIEINTDLVAKGYKMVIMEHTHPYPYLIGARIPGFTYGVAGPSVPDAEPFASNNYPKAIGIIQSMPGGFMSPDTRIFWYFGPAAMRK